MRKQKQKIAYVTGTRADFGIVTPLLKKFEQHPHFALQLYATGMHLMPKFGSSIHVVRSEFPHVQEIPVTFENNTPEAVTQFGGELLAHLAGIFAKQKPDIVHVHGDRIEMLMTAIAANYLRIPIIHTQGGDLSGTVDDITRHTISRLAQLHFVATPNAKKILLANGEESWRIKVVGTLALDTVLHQKLKTKAEVLEFLKFDTDFLLLTLHPISENVQAAGKQMKIVLRSALSANLPAVVMYPNADPGSELMIQEIEKMKSHPRIRIFRNLDYATFLSLEKHARVWVGNSSAGIVDSPSFKTPVVNVGLRQAGRIWSANIINVGYNEVDITSAIKKAIFDQKFLKKALSVVSPWGKGRTSDKIIDVLEGTTFDEKILNKKTKSF